MTARARIPVGIVGASGYGGAEAARPLLAHPRFEVVAAAGCFATALQLALLPLRGLDLGFLAASAATGSSGSGMAPSDTTHHPTRAQDFRAYKVLSHQHAPEVERLLRESGASDPEVNLVPHSGPFVRGIFTTATVLLDDPADPSALEALYREVYAGERFVRFRKGTPRVSVVAGTNFCDVAVHAKGRRAVVLTAIDNLGKGMAGQAVQNLNLLFGLPETDGLRDAGARP